MSWIHLEIVPWIYWMKERKKERKNRIISNFANVIQCWPTEKVLLRNCYDKGLYGCTEDIDERLMPGFACFCRDDMCNHGHPSSSSSVSLLLLLSLSSLLAYVVAAGISNWKYFMTITGELNQHFEKDIWKMKSGKMDVCCAAILLTVFFVFFLVIIINVVQFHSMILN
jgi:hypothetical protein